MKFIQKIIVITFLVLWGANVFSEPFNVAVACKTADGRPLGDYVMQIDAANLEGRPESAAITELRTAEEQGRIPQNQSECWKTSPYQGPKSRGQFICQCSIGKITDSKGNPPAVDPDWIFANGGCMRAANFWGLSQDKKEQCVSYAARCREGRCCISVGGIMKDQDECSTNDHF
jgi:hypothetical protein